MSLKQNRIIKIVMEFVKAGTSYDITGIDLGLAKFFYRESQMLFQDLATGDYTISTGGGKQILTITNPELLAKIEAFQVAYVLDFDASKYDTQWNVDINTLKDKYNQLLDVTFNVWEYVRKIGFVADDTAMQIILPQLNTGEVWVKTDTGWRGLNVGDIESNINAFWIEFNKKTQEILEQIVAAGKVQEGLLEDFAQQKIKEINEEGLKLEVTQVGHGFIFNAVQFDKTTGTYTKADVNTGADGIAVRIDDDRFYLSSNGIIEIPANAVDSKGNPYELDEYYFLDNEVAGGCTPEKPIHTFQALFCVVNKKGVKSALVEIGDPIDLNPRILVDEINSLGLATTDQVVLSEPTIADLIASKKYKVGDVVQVLGYYAKGDGAHHKRIAKAEDDGSGEQGQNGIWWCIVISNRIYNVRHFGAKGDFSTEDTLAFEKVANICTGVFYVPNGRYLISRPIEMKNYFSALKGEGVGYSTLIANSEMDILFKIKEGQSYFQIKDIRFNGNKKVKTCLDTTFSYTPIPAPSVCNSYDNIIIEGYSEVGWIATRNNDCKFNNILARERRNIRSISTNGSGGALHFNDCKLYGAIEYNCQNISFVNCVLVGLIPIYGDEKITNLFSCYVYSVDFNNDGVYSNFLLSDNTRFDGINLYGTRVESSSNGFIFNGSGVLPDIINMDGGLIKNPDNTKYNVYTDSVKSKNIIFNLSMCRIFKLQDVNSRRLVSFYYKDVISEDDTKRLWSQKLDGNTMSARDGGGLRLSDQYNNYSSIYNLITSGTVNSGESYEFTLPISVGVIHIRQNIANKSTVTYCLNKSEFNKQNLTRIGYSTPANDSDLILSKKLINNIETYYITSNVDSNSFRIMYMGL